MSGFYDNLREHHQQHKERREERREERHEAHHERHDHGGRRDDYDSDLYGGRHRRDDEAQYSQGRYQGQEQERYAAPMGPPPSTGGRGPSGFASQGGLGSGDFASDDDIARMVASGDFEQRQGRQGYGSGSGYGGAGGERRYDAPSGPPPGQGYGGRGNDYGRYDPPSGPSPGQGYGEREHDRYDGPPPGRAQQGHGSASFGGAGYGGEGPDRQNQYGSQGRSQYESESGPQSGYGKSQVNTPAGGFTASRDDEDRYGGSRNEPARRGEAASYYNQQSQGDHYGHLAGIAQEHGEDDPEVYRKATQGLHDRIQAQAPSRDDDIVDAHRKAYGGDDHGPMDTDAIGAAAAMEAFKQAATSTGSSNVPAGGFKAGKTSDITSATKPAGAVAEEEEDEAAARGGGGGGLQDKLMALAMSHAGKLFDKKNAGSTASGGDQTQDKAQAMQSAAATAMQLFAEYQKKGKLDSGDMSKVFGLAKNFM